jgi:hypothetical protein
MQLFWYLLIIVLLVISVFITAPQTQAENFKSSPDIKPLKAFSKRDNDKLYINTPPNIPVDPRETYFIGFDADKYGPKTDFGFKYDGIYTPHDFAHDPYETREFTL